MPDADTGVTLYVSYAQYVTCALLANGFLRCWGDNGLCQLGWDLHTVGTVGDNEVLADVGVVPLFR